jgi:hypothetical protein
MSRRAPWKALAFLAAFAAAGCAPRAPVAPAPAPLPLPELPAESPAPAPAVRLPRPSASDPLAGRPPGEPVTLAARDTDVRALLIALGEAAGLSLVIDPSIRGRTTVNFTDVPALEAFRQVLAAANLGIAAGAPEIPFGPTVFYASPVDVERASAELIQSRFRVSAELADFLTANRLP